MKCKWCGKEMRYNGKYCNYTCCCGENKNIIITTEFEDGTLMLNFYKQDAINLIKMRAEHAEQKERIAELEKQLADLTPPIKAGQEVYTVSFILGSGWGVKKVKCIGCYRDEFQHWVISHQNDIGFTNEDIYGETAFVTRFEAIAEAEVFNGGNE